MMCNQVSISVIIATYKQYDILIDCLKSLHIDCSLNFEVIVVDDGGNLDKNIENEILWLNIKWIYISTNVGQAGAQLKGAQLASGEILAFLDDDAAIDKNWILSIYNYFENYKDISVMVGHILPIDDSHILSRMRQTIYDLRAKKYSDLEYRNNLINKYNLHDDPEITICDHVSGGNFAIRKKLFFYINGFRTDIRRNNDHDFSKRILEAGYCIGYNPSMIIYHHHHKGYQVLFKNMIAEGRSHIKMLPRNKLKIFLDIFSNFFFIPFKIINFKEMLNADKIKIKVYFIYTFLQFLDEIGRILEGFRIMFFGFKKNDKMTQKKHVDDQ